MRSLRGTTTVVPDKSLTHRGVLLAALAEGRTVLTDPNPGGDCRATLDAVEALGMLVRREPNTWIIDGGLFRLREPEDVLDLGNSGTGMRLLTGLLSPRPFLSVLTGDRSLRRRPMSRLIEPLRSMGANIEGRTGMRAPLVVRGGRLQGRSVAPAMASAQVKSALLLAGLGLEDGEVRVTEPSPSRDHTERLLGWLGAPIRQDGDTVVLQAGARLQARDWSVPGDLSAAIFFVVAAVITENSRITVDGVGLNPTRMGAMQVLRRMGAHVEHEIQQTEGPEPRGRISASSSPLRPTQVGGDEIPRLIDEIPVLAVAAACAQGSSRFSDVGELRFKESDRIRSTCDLLRALGVEVEEEADAFVVHGTGRLRGGWVEAHDDHRIAMAARVAGCAAEGEVVVDSLRMIATSDPGFLGRLEMLMRERG
jgi:3-phosphoshikimate 1-carboxyvinyltransferase